MLAQIWSINHTFFFPWFKYALRISRLQAGPGPFCRGDLLLPPPSRLMLLANITIYKFIVCYVPVLEPSKDQMLISGILFLPILVCIRQRTHKSPSIEPIFLSSITLGSEVKKEAPSYYRAAVVTRKLCSTRKCLITASITKGRTQLCYC